MIFTPLETIDSCIEMLEPTGLADDLRELRPIIDRALEFYKQYQTMPLVRRFLELQEKELTLNKIALHCEGKTTVLTADLKRLGLK